MLFLFFTSQIFTGRGPSIWDTFSHIQGNVLNNDTGDVTSDAYHHYLEDVTLIKALKVPRVIAEYGRLTIHICISTKSSLMQ